MYCGVTDGRSYDWNAKSCVVITNSSRFCLQHGCYHYDVFNFGNPKTPGQWIGHIAVAIIGLFLIWWLLRLFVF